ncbi:MAG: HAD family hydrolase [Thermoplasmata archaeon]
MPRSDQRTRRSLPTILPKVVLFDMDDTIFDHSLSCRAALGRLRRGHRFLRARSLDDLQQEYLRLLGVMHRDVALGRRTREEARAERFLRLADWQGHPIDPRTAVGLAEEYREHYLRLRRPVRGAPEFLRALNGRTRIGIVTNSTTLEQTEKLAFLGLDRIVEFLVTSEEIGAAKPEPAIFRAALDRAGALPSEAVMVGDWWAGDIVGARDVGIRAVWFNRFGATAPSSLAAPEFSSFRPVHRLERLLEIPGPPSPGS